MQYKIEISPENLAIIGEALEAMPFRRVAPLLGDLQRQVAEQEQAAQKAAPEQQDTAAVEDRPSN